MLQTTLEKASVNDAVHLTAIMKKTFDYEAEKWISNRDIIDYNIQPPGYTSVEMTKYMIRELEYFKVMYDGLLVGGIIATISGKSYGRIDRIFINPEHQGNGIGSAVINLIEKEFPFVRAWDLETSSRQLNNHHFYKKMGYVVTFEGEEEYCFVKHIKQPVQHESMLKDQNLSYKQIENSDLSRSEFYQVTMEGSSVSNSNVSHIHMSNCNLSHSKFQNINFRKTMFADLNLSDSEFIYVTLSGARFLDTNLGDKTTPLIFERCDLTGSKLINCDLKHVEIENSDITGMKIDNIPVEELLHLYYQSSKS
ncbi:GNAT family N-acetyltransferase [Fictibacillus norfolkensis]|uniref:GNAT family N-acetyltransferase n=1 Tax=Fictibacillus norfolkensis TaxID=2762233 RepID=A0ABR8SKD2_9BACL|nr:GNAT family N-acetyltransferase [Fictibacillus norfolkensis]MBD7963935.1 GNAT family N-acetyltransferase [Fictibacillus norfolkensis]